MQKKIVVYSTDKCQYCKQIKEFLTKEGFKFTECNLSENPKKVKYIQEKTQQMSVPVTFVGDKFVVGWKKMELSRLLGLI